MNGTGDGTMAAWEFGYVSESSDSEDASPSAAAPTFEERLEEARAVSRRMRLLEPGWFAKAGSEQFELELVTAAPHERCGGVSKADVQRHRGLLELDRMRCCLLYASGRAGEALALARSMSERCARSAALAETGGSELDDMLSRLALACGQWDEAARLLRSRVARQPGDLAAWVQLLRAQSASGAPIDELAQSWARVLSMAPRSPSLWCGAGEALRGSHPRTAWLCGVLALAHSECVESSPSFAISDAGLRAAGVRPRAEALLAQLGVSLGLPTSEDWPRARLVAGGVVPTAELHEFLVLFEAEASRCLRPSDQLAPGQRLPDDDGDDGFVGAEEL